MGLVPFPSHIHYELLLQILEQQTLPSLDHTSRGYAQAQQVIIQLRKALAQQKALEAQCAQADLTVDHRWSVNQQPRPMAEVSDS